MAEGLKRYHDTGIHSEKALASWTPERRRQRARKSKAWSKTKKGRNTLRKASRIRLLRSKKRYIVVDPAGRTYRIKNLATFCRRRGLSRQSMGDVVKGR